MGGGGGGAIANDPQRLVTGSGGGVAAAARSQNGFTHSPRRLASSARWSSFGTKRAVPHRTVPVCYLGDLERLGDEGLDGADVAERLGRERVGLAPRREHHAREPLRPVAVEVPQVPIRIETSIPSRWMDNKEWLVGRRTAGGGECVYVLCGGRFLLPLSSEMRGMTNSSAGGCGRSWHLRGRV